MIKDINLTIRYREVHFSISKADLEAMEGPSYLRIHDILLGKMRAEGYPYHTLKDHASITQWYDEFEGNAHWHVTAHWAIFN